jgi:4a-hydroxytetrahydrobiopterin dehydratase
MPKLTDKQIEQELEDLPGWEYKDGAISKLYRFKEFRDGIEFVNHISQVAELQDHHPDMTINYTRVGFRCATHSEGGVTDKDIKLAHDIEEAYAEASK